MSDLMEHYFATMWQVYKKDKHDKLTPVALVNADTYDEAWRMARGNPHYSSGIKACDMVVRR